MSKRRKTSGGQALVLVTLALLAMVGIMGLAVDLGWSFFVEKQAQAAADGAALAAAQEAMTRLRGGDGGVTGFTCSSNGGTTATTVDCETAAPGQNCSGVASTSNLNNGCQYAKKNGFDWTKSGSNQSVWMQSNDGQFNGATCAAPAGSDLPPTAPGVCNISYWVTVRTFQNIPQLFSAIHTGNATGAVSAIATAAIAASIAPGSFFGMNRAGDCLTGADAGNCGLDVITGHGKGKGSGGSQACGPNSITSDLCAPAGIILASSCAATSNNVCDEAFAGDDQGNAAVASSLTVMGPSGAVSGTWEDLNGNPLAAVHTTNAATFADPTAPNPQPPLMNTQASGSNPLTPCGIKVGTSIPNGTVLGGYQYFSYSLLSGGKPIPSGVPISISGNVTFSSSTSTGGVGVCPGWTPTGAAIPTGSFPTYVFWGGLAISGATTFGPGQYVMAGVASGGSDGTLFTAGGTITGDTATGTMFIFTDGNYPGLSTQMAALPNNISMPTLYQGQVDVSGGNSMTLYGVVDSKNSSSNLPAALDLYSGVVWWQDRRNSDVGYNQPAGTPGCPNCTKDDGSVMYCASAGDCPNPNSSQLATMKADNHVTPNSPSFVFGNGNTKIALNGVFYQPRGAWVHIGNGNTGFNCPLSSGQCPLQIVTGAIVMDSGNTRVVLNGPTNPLLTFKATLVQ